MMRRTGQFGDLSTALAGREGRSLRVLLVVVL